jgi:hypothetical protein
LFAEPLRVGVGNLSEQQLGADSDNLNSHWPRLSYQRGNTASPCTP